MNQSKIKSFHHGWKSSHALPLFYWQAFWPCTPQTSLLHDFSWYWLLLLFLAHAKHLPPMSGTLHLVFPPTGTQLFYLHFFMVNFFTAFRSLFKCRFIPVSPLTSPYKRVSSLPIFISLPCSVLFLMAFNVPDTLFAYFSFSP